MYLDLALLNNSAPSLKLGLLTPNKYLSSLIPSADPFANSWLNTLFHIWSPVTLTGKLFNIPFTENMFAEVLAIFRAVGLLKAPTIVLKYLLADSNCSPKSAIPLVTFSAY